MNILATGNYATGSSAVYDYLREFNNVHVPFNRDGYEHTIFYMPHGLIDLENILFSNSGYIANDAAIRNFKKMSYNIYKYNYKFYGGYKKYIGKEFITMTDDFIATISKTFESRTIGKIQKMRFSFIKACGQIIYALFKGYKISSFGMSYKTDKGPGYVLNVNHEEFNEAKRKYIAKYIELTKENNEHVIYDHLLLPINADYMDFFPINSRLFIVDRDPRDVYTLIKKYYMTSAKIGYEKPPFPIENVNDFIASYKNFRANYNKYSSYKNVMFIKFEDLIFDYEKTTSKIKKYVGFDNENHKYPKRFFNPEISINNVKLFDDNDEEIKLITKELKEYLYDFSKIDLGKFKIIKSDIF